VPTNEELAIARDTQRILSTLESRPAAVPVAPEPARPPAFKPDEIAELVVLWAKNRQADASVLARKWAQKLGRAVSAAETARELERLSLPASGPRPVKNATAN